jgi:putative glutamine amidotransferase
MKVRHLLYICDVSQGDCPPEKNGLSFEPIMSIRNTLRVGITDCGKFENYRRWMEMVPDTEVIKLSPGLQNLSDLSNCDGILFSGGEDLQPRLYGKPEYEAAYQLKDISAARDDFEFQVLDQALSFQKPVLGICRGLQLINVFLGGSLVADIPLLLHSHAHGKKQGVDQTHPVRVEPDSLLAAVCGQQEGIVNSAHHQSVDRPADPLKISAWSNPGVVEAMEWKDPADKSWLLMVQWHPERMEDLQSPFSLPLKNAFLKTCLQNRKDHD